MTTEARSQASENRNPDAVCRHLDAAACRRGSTQTVSTASPDHNANHCISYHIHSFITSMHHWECVASNVEISLQSGPFWATPIVSFKGEVVGFQSVGVECSSSVLRPSQHNIGYMGDGFYRSKDPTNSIKVLKENLQKTNQTTKTTQNTHA